MNPRSILTTALLALTACLCLPLHAEPAAEEQKPAPFPMQHFVGKWTEQGTYIKPEPGESEAEHWAGKLLDDGKRLVIVYANQRYWEFTQDPKTGLVTSRLYKEDELIQTLTGRWNADTKQITLQGKSFMDFPKTVTLTLTQLGKIQSKASIKDLNGTIVWEWTGSSTRKK